MESLLKRIFDFGVAQNSKYACHWVDKGQHWYVCPGVIYSVSESVADTEVQPYNGGAIPEKLKANPSIAYPENVFKLVLEELSAAFDDFFWTDEYIYSFKTKEAIPVPVVLPFRRYMTINPTLKNHWNDFKVSLGTHGNIPMFRVSDGQETVWAIAAQNTFPEKLELNINGTKIVPCDWSDKDKCYMKLRKEEKMAKLENFDQLVKGTLGAVPSEIQPKDPEKTGKENPVEVVKEEAKEVAPAEVKEPVKRTRKKAETTPLTDLTKVIEQLAGAIPEKMTSEDALKAVRQLRDLQLAAARRAANISLQYIENTEGAVATLAAIKAQL